MCCKSIFFLPPESDVPETGVLYAKTMKAMDTMLEGFVRNCPNTSVSIELENMLKVMLDFAVSKDSAVRESAVRRIERLGDFIISYFVSEITDDYENYSDDEPTELYIPILGQLLGILFIFTSDKDSIRFTALETLSHIYKIIRKGRECILREDMLYYAVRHKKLEYAKLPFSTTSTPCEIAKVMSSGLAGDLVRSISRHLV
ncbi:uncharacterized protein [Anas platyrhynchos]|uniref:uncharacterized protein n=1 Tax=Anas platyrhynchos TaxID=8839 RepID=UPI003AF2C260